ncbi:glycosyltransferase [Roseibium sp. Sym1]|uniref:glycosyltransferase n=1 Tax=Roseibium sp. Sym1 TaxID=3016006 RepID=UPI0022B3CB2A|nr:glycosyltransferase [Roseibium sp. Sym1]
MTKVCIFTYSYMHRHHTMVNFHIDNMFDGNSCACVIDEREFKSVERPRLVRDEIRRGLYDAVVGPVIKVSNKLRKLPAYSIFGSERKAILDFLDREKPDVILCEFGCIGVDVAEAIGDRGLPIFTYYRGYDATMRVRSKRQRNLTHRAFRKMTGVFFVSDYLRRNLAHYGLEHPNSHVFPSGVNTDRFTPSTKKKLSFIAVGRLIEKKRPDLTVEAFCKEAKGFPDATLNVLGGGPMLEACREIVRREGMENQVTLHTEQPHENVLKYLREAEFFLQHSVTSPGGDAEGAPTSIQEALACGCTVIATRHAGIPDLIEEGKTGFLVDEMDLDGYRALIRSALSGEINAPEVAAAARDFAVANLDNRRLIKRVEAVLESAVRT